MNWQKLGVSWFAVSALVLAAALVAPDAVRPVKAQFNGCPAGFCTTAQLTMTGVGGFSGGGGGLTYTQTGSSAVTAGNPTTWTGVNIGTPAANRIVVVGLVQDYGGPITTAVTIGGVTATRAAFDNSNVDAEIWYANVPTGTTATVQINGGYTPGFNWGFAGVIQGSTQSMPSTTGNTASTATSPVNLTLSVPSGGITILLGVTDGSLSAPSFNNATLDASNTSNSRNFAHNLTLTGSQTFGFNFNTGGSHGQIVGLTWGP